MSVKIHSIRLRNCQSWKDTTIQLSGGLNVIVAPNQTGKSVIFKMLKATCSPKYYNREELQLLIRYGAEFAEATYLFTDKSAAIVRVFPQRIIYFYTENCSTTPFTQQEGIPQRGILEKLSLLVEQESGFIANILDLDQNLLLVNNSNKSNHNLVKILTEHQDLNRLGELFTNKYPIYKAKLMEVRKTKARLEYTLDDLDIVDVDKLEDNIKKSEAFINLFKSLLAVYESFVEIDRLNISNINFEEAINLTELGIRLEELYDIDLPEIPQKIDEDLISLCNLAINVEEITKELNALPKVPRIVDDRLLNVFNTLVTIHEELDLMPEIEDSTRIDDGLRMLTSISNLINVHNEFVNLGKLDLQYKNGKALEEQYKSKLNIDGKNFECPIHGKIKFVNKECIPV